MSNQKTRCVRAGCIAVALVLTPVTGTLAAEANAEYSVPGGPVFEALNALAAQASYLLYADPLRLKGLTAQPIAREHDVESAVAHLLAGTGVEYTVDPLGRQIIIGKIPPAAPTPRNRRRSPSSVESLATDSQPAETAAGVGSEVVVTGTQISGGTPIAGNLITIGLDKFAANTVGTMANMISTLPQMSGSGPSQTLNAPGPEAQTNSGLGGSLNLRGLGADATLVMIDGRRLAPAGSSGDFVDASLIPFLAIDHVDILPTGASAVYGSDAIGGVVNFVSRDPAEPSQTRIEEDSVTHGSLRQTRFSQGVGETWNSGGIRLTLEVQKTTDLRAEDRSFETSNLSGSGGPDLDPDTTNPGNIQVGPVIWAIPRGQTGPLSPNTPLRTLTENRQDLYQDAHVLPKQSLASLFLKGTQQLDDAWSLDFAGLFSGRHTTEQSSGASAILTVPGSNAFYFNPTVGTDPVTVDYNFRKDLGPQTTSASVYVAQGALDIHRKVGETSTLTLSLEEALDVEHQGNTGKVNPNALAIWLASDNPKLAFNPFRDGSFTNPLTLAAIQAHPWFDGRSRISSVALKFEGGQLTLPGGTLSEAVGLELRDQTLQTDWSQDIGAPANANRYGRRLVAAFAEFDLPLFGANHRYIGLQGLDLSFAARLERNSDFGRTFSPLSQITWSPWHPIHITASWGLSFRAPPLVDLDPGANTSIIAPLADPAAHGALNNFLVASGNNASLSESRADTKTLGAGFGIPISDVTTLAGEATYFHILYTGRIASQLFTPDLLNDPTYASVVTRNPSQAFRDQLCSAGQFFGTIAQCKSADIAGIIDLRLRNTDSLFTQGIDLHGRLISEQPLGRLVWELYGTYVLRFAERQSAGSAVVPLLNTLGNPIDLRLLSAWRWEGRTTDFAVTCHYQNHYRNPLTVPVSPIGSWTTIDLQLAYRPPTGASSSFRNIEIGLSAQNVADRNPPYAVNLTTQSGWDLTNATAFGRVVGLYLSKRW